MSIKEEGTIGAFDYSIEKRKNLAKKSQTYSCPSCGKISEILSAADASHNGPASDPKTPSSSAASSASARIADTLPASNMDGIKQWNSYLPQFVQKLFTKSSNKSLSSCQRESDKQLASLM